MLPFQLNVAHYSTVSIFKSKFDLLKRGRKYGYYVSLLLIFIFFLYSVNKMKHIVFKIPHKYIYMFKYCILQY